MDFFEFFPVILGAILALAGGIVAQFIESWLRKRNRRNELLAERQLNACIWIYSLFKRVDFYIRPENPDFNKAENIFSNSDEQFWEEYLVLPGECPDAWIMCRKSVFEKDKQEALAQCHRGYEKIEKLLKVRGFEMKRLTKDS